jgi:hypothetical protein
LKVVQEVLALTWILVLDDLRKPPSLD